MQTEIFLLEGYDDVVLNPVCGRFKDQIPD